MTCFPHLSTQWVLDSGQHPPVYTRPLIGSELSMQRYWNTFDADGEVCLGVDFTSTLTIEELRDRARKALDKLRFVSPIIACTIEDVVSPRWVYTPSADREAWLNLAFAVEERGVSLNASEFVQNINLKRVPYIDGNGTTTIFRAYLLTTSKKDNNERNEYGLYFHSSHTIIDAGPAMHALNLMCEWISGDGMDVQIEPSEEWRNLPVDPVTATGGPPKEWEASGTRLLQLFAEQDARTVPCHTLAPPTRPLDMSDPPFRYATSMSAAETAAIVVATKKLGVSVSSLFHAAHCLAQFKMNPISGPETEVDFSSDRTVVSLERYFKSPVDPKTHFISSFTFVPLRFSMARPLMEQSTKSRLIMTARILQDRFDQCLANPCLPPLLAVMESMNSAKTIQEAKVAVEPAMDQAPWCCAFNNVGVVESRLRTHYKGMDIVDMRIGNRLRNCMTVHMWTIHSKFYFQVQGSTAWRDECIRTLLDETLRIGSLVLDAEFH